MDQSEAHDFETSAHAQAAMAVCRWDDRAKDASATTPGLEEFRPLLERLLHPA